MQVGVGDTVFVYAKVLDTNGNNSRVNNFPVSIRLEGDAQLLSPANVNTEDGIAAALIRVGSDLSSIRISASADKVEDAFLEIK